MGSIHGGINATIGGPGTEKWVPLMDTGRMVSQYIQKMPFQLIEGQELKSFSILGDITLNFFFLFCKNLHKMMIGSLLLLFSDKIEISSRQVSTILC